MAVKRIVANLAAHDTEPLRHFYAIVLGMQSVMDHGWIVTFAEDGMQPPQLSIASEGGSGTPVPDLSIEVDDLAAVQERLLLAGVVPEYGPVQEPWGVERFFVRDPTGRLLNILAHR